MQHTTFKVFMLAPLVTLGLSGCFEKSTDNAPPSIQGVPQTDAMAGAAYSFQPSATDPDGDSVTFVIENLPAWAAFDAATGRLSGTPSLNDVGVSKNIVIAATDNKSRTELPAFQISVRANGAPPANTAPTISGTPATTAAVGQAYSFQPSAFDADGNALTDRKAHV